MKVLARYFQLLPQGPLVMQRQCHSQFQVSPREGAFVVAPFAIRSANVVSSVLTLTAKSTTDNFLIMQFITWSATVISDYAIQHILSYNKLWCQDGMGQTWCQTPIKYIVRVASDAVSVLSCPIPHSYLNLPSIYLTLHRKIQNQ